MDDTVADRVRMEGEESVAMAEEETPLVDLKEINTATCRKICYV